MLNMICRIILYCSVLIFIASNVCSEEWVVLSDLDVTKRSDRIKYAKFLRDQHYRVVDLLVPELTPDERKWVEIEEIKIKELSRLHDVDRRAIVFKLDRFQGAPINLHRRFKVALKDILFSLNLIITSNNIEIEIVGWNSLVSRLLAVEFKGKTLKNTMDVINKKGIIFSEKNFAVFDGMSVSIAQEINTKIVFEYLILKPSFIENKD